MKIDQKRGDSIQIHCNNCNRITNHNIESICNRYLDNEDGEWKNEDWMIVKCLGCDNYSFLLEYTQSDYIDSERGEHFTTGEIFPERNSEHHIKTEYLYAPNDVKYVYYEVVETYNKKLMISCAAMIRTIIEAICADQNIEEGTKIKTDGSSIPSKTLEAKINMFEDNKILTNNQVAILHDLRKLGNNALHELKVDDKQMIKQAIETIEHIMDTIYIIPYKIKQNIAPLPF
jgi:hypothetical protein